MKHIWSIYLTFLAEHNVIILNNGQYNLLVDIMGGCVSSKNNTKGGRSRSNIKHGSTIVTKGEYPTA